MLRVRLPRDDWSDAGINRGTTRGGETGLGHILP